MNEPRQKKSPTVEVLLIGAGALVLIAAAVWWRTGSPRLESDRAHLTSRSMSDARRLAGFAGDRACAECHPGEAALHSRSGHSKTLHLAAETAVARWLDGRRVNDPENPRVSWSYSLRDGRLGVERSDEGTTERLLIDYAFGSGSHATTFVSMTEPDPAKPSALEHRLTYYAETETLDVTPGQEKTAPAEGTTPRGRSVASLKILKCFGCHTTVTSAQSRDLLDVTGMVANISCERCHGPARAHVAAARRGGSSLAMRFGSEGWNADSLMKACGDCHRHPDRAPPNTIRTDNIEIVRYQPVGLMQSACYQRGGGTLSCVSCHDPHAPASRDRTKYEGVCLSCHATAAQTTCRVSPRSGCLDCHMPRRNAGQGILFTDHWIRKPR
jgi:predicted CXXCH cytochrome family protein